MASDLPQFKPLEQVILDIELIKTWHLLALASAKRAGDLCALSVHPSCMSISKDRDAMEL